MNKTEQLFIKSRKTIKEIKIIGYAMTITAFILGLVISYLVIEIF